MKTGISYLRRFVSKRLTSLPWYVHRRAYGIISSPKRYSAIPYGNKWRTRAFYSQFIKPGDVCFDIGANVGIRTEIFLELGAVVVAVEPQEQCIQELQSKFGGYRRFHLVKKGLADYAGEHRMRICDTASTISTMSDNWKRSVQQSGRFADFNWTREVTIEVTTLDNLIEIYGKPKFCKIDVEGFELQVLKGLSEPVEGLSFEFTYPEMFDEAMLCMGHLTQLGMNRFNYSIDNTFEFARTDWTTHSEIEIDFRRFNTQLKVGDIYVWR